jgi:hypothetical protein
VRGGRQQRMWHAHGCPGLEDMAIEACIDGAGVGRERGHQQRRGGQLRDDRAHGRQLGNATVTWENER